MTSLSVDDEIIIESEKIVNVESHYSDKHVSTSESINYIDPEARPQVFKSNLHEAAAVLVLTFATVMNTASTGVMSIAVPALARYFQISGGDVSWSVTSFQLMSGATILLFSGYAEIFTHYYN